MVCSLCNGLLKDQSSKKQSAVIFRAPMDYRELEMDDIAHQ
jgi:hypothetical protein